MPPGIQPSREGRSGLSLFTDSIALTFYKFRQKRQKQAWGAGNPSSVPQQRKIFAGDYFIYFYS
jgi:hypothetical protein